MSRSLLSKTKCTPHPFRLNSHTHLQCEFHFPYACLRSGRYSAPAAGGNSRVSGQAILFSIFSDERWCDEKEKSQLIKTRRPRFFFVISVGIQVTLRVKNRVAADRGWGDLLPWEPSRQKPTYQKKGRSQGGGGSGRLTQNNFTNKTPKPRLRCRRPFRSY